MSHFQAGLQDSIHLHTSNKLNWTSQLTQLVVYLLVLQATGAITFLFFICSLWLGIQLLHCPTFQRNSNPLGFQEKQVREMLLCAGTSLWIFAPKKKAHQTKSNWFRCSRICARVNFSADKMSAYAHKKSAQFRSELKHTQNISGCVGMQKVNLIPSWRMRSSTISDQYNACQYLLGCCSLTRARHKLNVDFNFSHWIDNTMQHWRNPCWTQHMTSMKRDMLPISHNGSVQTKFELKKTCQTFCCLLSCCHVCMEWHPKLRSRLVLCQETTPRLLILHFWSIDSTCSTHIKNLSAVFSTNQFLGKGSDNIWLL